jgi:ferredoxin
MDPGQPLVVEPAGLDAVFDSLRRDGRTLIGPRLRDGAIVLDEIAHARDLPRGLGDEQDAGRYRLHPRPDEAFFGYAVGPHAWKRWLHPPTLVRWRARREGGRGFVAVPDDSSVPPLALVGVRPCELAAIRIQDRVFLAEPFADPAYSTRRDAAFVLAVECGAPSGSCFCASMGTGPAVGPGYDLALTEVLGERHRLVVRVGTERGARVMESVPHSPADELVLAAARAVTEEAARRMGRTLDTEGLKERLYRRYEDPYWDEVARRCLGCGNCTMVCPTCFCATVEDVSDLAGTATERRRVWDSCFSQEFSYVHGGSVRTSGGARYRQWITHKLATWHDQFGGSGCVGCGRCITWCPVGIDITEEARALEPGRSHGSAL